MLAIRAGDREAFERLVEMYQRRLFGLCLMMVRDPGGAEEVVQDAFVRAFTHLDAYDERRPFYPWLAAVAVRLGQNWLRRDARVSVREGTEFGPQHAPAAADNPLGELLHGERERRLWQSVAALPSGERTAVYPEPSQAVGVLAAGLLLYVGGLFTLTRRPSSGRRGIVSPDETV